jgi:hypothetical protein
VSAQRPLLTAAAAGALLCALWFVPSANATTVSHGARAGQSAAAPAAAPLADAAAEVAAPTSSAGHLALADTGSMDTTPYLIGGVGFLGVGGVLVTAAVRRSRTMAL